MRLPFPITMLLLSAALVVTTRAQEKKDAPKAPPFENEIKAFEESDKTAPPPQHGIEFVGSSSIRKWTTLKQDFEGLPVYNRGFGGSQAEHATLHADRIVLPYKPKTIVFYEGDNDLAAGKTPQRVCDDYAAFVAEVQKALPDARFFILAVKPSVARIKLLDKQRETNRLLKELAAKDREHLTFVDVFSPMLDAAGQPRPDLYVDDKLHMNAKGYKIWTAILKPLLK